MDGGCLLCWLLVFSDCLAITCCCVSAYAGGCCGFMVACSLLVLLCLLFVFYLCLCFDIVVR